MIDHAALTEPEVKFWAAVGAVMFTTGATLSITAIEKARVAVVVLPALSLTTTVSVYAPLARPVKVFAPPVQVALATVVGPARAHVVAASLTPDGVTPAQERNVRRPCCWRSRSRSTVDIWSTLRLRSWS